jgi:hypothetical protein
MVELFSIYQEGEIAKWLGNDKPTYRKRQTQKKRVQCALVAAILTYCKR